MLVASTLEDVPRIQTWTAADPYHNNVNLPEWWLTGQGAIAFRLDDASGPVAYFRIDSGHPDFRLNCQFAPTEIVGKRRLIRAMLELFPVVISFAKQDGGKGLVFNSTSPTLTRFMGRLGFLPIGDDDYRFEF